MIDAKRLKIASRAVRFVGYIGGGYECCSPDGITVPSGYEFCLNFFSRENTMANFLIEVKSEYCRMNVQVVYCQLLVLNWAYTALCLCVLSFRHP